MPKTPEELLTLERKAQAIWAKRLGVPYVEVALNEDGTSPLPLMPATKAEVNLVAEKLEALNASTKSTASEPNKVPAVLVGPAKATVTKAANVKA